MACSNCYNGCPQVISDQCVKYTGVDVPILGIQTGDSLSYVEQAIITFLTSTLDGTGIKVNIDPTILCPIVNQYLVQCEDLNVDNLFETLIKVACDLQAQITVIDGEVTVIQNTLTILNADYDKKCLTGVTNSSDTHDIVQAVIDKLCQFITDVGLTYVKIADINTYIQNYLNSIGSTLYSAKMVPYVAYEYYGPIGPTPTDPLSGFDGTGAGFGNWFKVYLCNGDNGTPDRRGRVGVGVTTGMNGVIPMDPAVSPANPLNPDYTLGNVTFGSNNIYLSVGQLPSHSHTNTVTVTVTPNPHKHFIAAGGDTSTSLGTTKPMAIGHSTGGNLGYSLVESPALVATNGPTNEVNLTVNVGVTINDTGGDLPHPNYQPGIGAFYIMYIP